MPPAMSEAQGSRGAGQHESKLLSPVLPRSRAPLLLLLVAIAALAVWWFTHGEGLVRPDRSWQRVRERGVLRVGMDLSYPPFGFVDDHAQPAGFDADLARALATQLGLRVEFVNLSYDGLYDALAAEQVDVLISALVVDPTRMDDFAYTEPYFNAGQVFVVRADGPAPQRMDDLAGHRLAVELGSDGDVEARRWTRRLAGIEVQPWPEAVSALAAVEVGQADVALVDTITARMVMREHLDLHLSGDPVTYEPYAIVVQQRHETLLGAIAQALSSLQADGTLADLLQRWL
jgi:polar amino acid transport system substrate-binding protein